MRATSPAVLVLAALSLAGCSTSTHSTDQPAPATSVAASPGTPSTTRATAPAQAVGDEPTLAALPTQDAASDASALGRATGFVRAWARPDLPAAQWWAGVKGFLSPAAAQSFQYTDPGRVPATKVTGQARIAGTASATSVRVIVPTDAGDQEVLIVRGGQDEPWLVASLTGPEQG